MEWGIFTVAAVAVSLASLFVRWRWPTVPPFLASAGFFGCVSIAVMSQISLAHPSPWLAISIAVNAAFFGGSVDYWLLTPNKSAEEANGATLRLTFHGDDRHPTSLRLLNIGSWFAYYSSHARIEGQAEDGSRTLLAQTPKTWAIFIAYDRPTEVIQIVASLNAAGLPPYTILLSTKRACVISFSADIPAGDLEIDVRAS